MLEVQSEPWEVFDGELGIIGKFELLTWTVALAAPAQGTAGSLCHPGEQEMVRWGWEQPGLVPRVPDSHPISFDAHVTFEARETIFTLKTEKGKITQGVEMRREKKN